MASTVDSSTRRSHAPYLIYEEQWASNDGTAQDLSWTAADGPALVPFKVEMEVLTPPTDRSIIQLHRTKASDSGSARTIRVRLETEVGGSLSGAVVLIRLFWLDQASGGIS